ncbi:MAG: hypothetical protein UR28_C0012G0022 [Candidatus Peregrinibacteria bacterium GW2011_GWF2_33_10]|nr:MAG: hypothetical protein UR28_C0012G0022 [Candidatus Peregrinibacteria bacterium GW2011_GWF2_33_10]OGJ44072.1 MAG: hypothetical protein A2263_01565 [Candidatus Peregrinibacteria bacterium RIFOXYA2_FULL_33_21]OGJ45718.1 MAG: hypothetical protein A2272_03860 [Candidatus Peregrinibacteria bacterium RIFOXYA12_FULL_33_12]OGJ51403.1 MAG: hypothetical protein A2307_02540 [Candidatus Peregrinibacteria bacterium RIFOXYB2_FULL_33_20]
MKYTLTSSKDSKLLENLIIKYGQIVTINQISDEAKKNLNQSQIEYLISSLTKKGWLIRVKKGLYVISDLSNRGFLSLSSYIIANLLVKNSYVSFESALQYHGMFDQLTNKIISISLKEHKDVNLQNTEYNFIKTKTDYYFGFKKIIIDNQNAQIATQEKALCDIINFHRSIYSIDLVIEKLKNYKNNINFIQMQNNIKQLSMTTLKIFGFIFDLLNIDSSELLKQSKTTKTAHKMTSDSRIFNAKWRLYYDSYFGKLLTLKNKLK